ncbi:hypothetical protein M3649_19235 [Ureibacillus chungkukjangi]|uniref:hypothetical protein n=1 Tax=Ureibacillus chungkukjangi TaxID=1202712 RepID=UPI0020404C39|nr:hypothetical protein [Ureibacillus chungkukjangi]MCM3390235.1 hypothetical protein [Ureibacillus chungkukjangi]
MGISKGDKENYLNLFITLLNKEAIEDIISERVVDLKWEYYFSAKMIDVYGRSETGKFLFVENQLSCADDRHLKSIGEIIEKAPNNSAIIWGATGFSSEILNKASKMILDVMDKRIEFYAVEINATVLPLLGKLDNTHILKVLDHLKVLNTVDTYNDIFDKYVSLYEDDIYIDRYKYEKRTERERTNAYIINELRNSVKYPNIFREKRTIDVNKIRYGFGRAGIDIEVIYSNNNGESYVSCVFTDQTEDIFKELVKHKDNLTQKINHEVIFDMDRLRIITFVKQYQHKFEKIDKLVELFDDYLFYLSNYTFYFGKSIQDEMWEQHKEGYLD